MKPANKNLRHYRIGGLTLAVRSDRPITDRTFDPKLRQFELRAPRRADARIKLHFALPAAIAFAQGTLVYRKSPWAIYRDKEGWSYVGISRIAGQRPHLVARFNKGHTSGDIYVPDDRSWRRGHLKSLTLFPTDQILLARLLADRHSTLLHSAGLILDGHGLLFLGHSSAGKSTICKMFARHAEILCDDRNIVRRAGQGFTLYGTWSHGTFAKISAGHAPLRAMFFLKQSRNNRISRIGNTDEVLKRLLPLVIRPLADAGWWEKTLDVLESLAACVPAYELEFDKSGKIIEVLEILA
ncbi:MAG TPA: hypothetical protein VMF29_06000 [Candidatus Edwardsbacteria bacterium]|nr:hypothetical protein [Candidatus Edwardsbacteria bacterium]